MPEAWTLARRVNVGITFGIVAAILFSLLAIILRLGMGAADYANSLGISFGWTIAIYFVTLPIAGSIGGVCGPLMRWAWGAFIVGTLVTLIPFAAVFVVRDHGGLPFGDLEVAGVMSAVIGGGGFFVGWMRMPHHRPRNEPPTL